MEISVELPLDADEFLRRECPTCLMEFKWYYGRNELTPEDWIDPEEYHCPYCAHPASVSSWHTQEQVDYITQVGMASVRDELLGEMRLAARRTRNDMIRIEVEGDAVPAPAPLNEPPDDMTMVEPPCHPFEPLKVILADDPLHCLVCGAEFVV